jgi:carboxyl-terminal processing protease
MRKILTAFIVVAVAFAAQSMGAKDEATQSKYEALFDALWTKVDQNFYDPHFHGVDWRAAGTRYREKLAGVHSDAEFERLAAAMLDGLHASHTYIRPPSESPASSAGIGVRVHTIEGKDVVTQVAPLSDAWRAGLRPGDVLLSSQSSLRGEVGTPAQVDVARCDGTRRTYFIRRTGAFWPPEEPGFRWSSIKLSEKKRVGLIVVDRFDDGAAELADRAMADLKDTQGLIIDIRANTGGNASALRLASYFGRGESPGIILLSRPYLVGLGHPVTLADVMAAPKVQGAYTDAAVFQAVGDKGGGAAFWTENVGAKRYTPPVVVLTGEDTGSAAEGFAWFMRLKTTAHLIGRRTAGAFLGGETFDLPSGWSVTLPVYGLWGPDGRDYGDKPVTPDETIALARIGVCHGDDPDVEAAMDYLDAARVQP